MALAVGGFLLLCCSFRSFGSRIDVPFPKVFTTDCIPSLGIDCVRDHLRYHANNYSIGSDRESEVRESRGKDANRAPMERLVADLGQRSSVRESRKRDCRESSS